MGVAVLRGGETASSADAFDPQIRVLDSVSAKDAPANRHLPPRPQSTSCHAIRILQLPIVIKAVAAGENVPVIVLTPPPRPPTTPISLHETTANHPQPNLNYDNEF